MDLTVVANNRWVKGNIREAVESWTRQGALPVRRELVPTVKPADLAFIWNGQTRELVALAQFRAAGGASSEQVGLRSARGYVNVPAFIVPVQLPEEVLPWQLERRRGLRAFVELDESTAEKLLEAASTTLPRVGSFYRDAYGARAERTIRREVLYVLNNDSQLMSAWHEWRRAGEVDEPFDEVDALRPVTLPEHPEEADSPALARFYLDEILAPLTALSWVSESAANIEGRMEIASTPGAADGLDVSKILEEGREGLFAEALLLRQFFKSYVDGGGAGGQ